MAKDIKISNGIDTIIINPNSLDKFKKLGYKESSGEKKIEVKTQPKKPEYKPNLKE